MQIFLAIQQELSEISVEVESGPTTGSSMGAAILDPPSWILVMFQLKIISF